MKPHTAFFRRGFLLLTIVGGALAYGQGLLNQIRSSYNEQWRASNHNFYPPSRTQTTRDVCVYCHTTEGFVAKTKGENLTAEEIAKPKDYGITCQACHDTEDPENMLKLRVTGDVTLPHGVSVSAGIAGACMSCHTANRPDPLAQATTSFRGPHEGTQAEMLAGTGALTYGQTLGSSVHTLVTFEGCLTCHKAGAPGPGEYGENHLGGHSFRMRWDGDTPEDPRDDIENTTACQRCHPGLKTFDMTAKGDYDGDGIIEGVQTEVKGLMAALAQALPRDEKGEVVIPTDLSKTTVEQRIAAYNYKFVAYDRSLGIHNTAYTVNLLRLTIEKLMGKKPAGVDAIGAAFVANRPTTSQAIAEYAESWKRSAHNFDPADEAFRGATTNAACVRCHDGSWFVKIQAKGQAQPDANLPEPAKIGHSCYVCHENENPTDILALRKTGPVTLPNGVVVNAGRAGLCISCHNGRRPNAEEYARVNFRGPHEGPQAEMFAATNAIFYGKKMRSTAHLEAIPDLCVTCHQQETLPPTQRGHREVGGHTLKMRWDGGTPANPRDDIQHVAVCQKCHPDVTPETGFDRLAREDFDADGKVEGIQTEIKGLLARLAKELPKDPTTGEVAIPQDLTKSTEAERRAYYNYRFVLNDGSFGVHNPLFAADLLRTTYTELTGKALTPPGSKVAWDVNGDGVVNILDIVLVAQHFGETVTPATSSLLAGGVSPDVDQNGKVDLTDVVRVAGAIQPSSTTPVGGVTATVWLDLERLPLDVEGGRLRVRVNVSSPERLAGYVLSLSYDPAVLTLESVGNGTYLARDTNAVFWSSPDVDEKAGRVDRVTAVALGKEVPKGSGSDLVSLVFRVRRLDWPAEKAIALRTIEAADETAHALRMRIGETRFNPSGVMWRSALLQNYPNPFNPETWIPFDLVQSAPVKVQILSMRGEVIRELDLGYLESGTYRTRDRAAHWDGKNELGERVASGTYFYRILAGSFSSIRKMVILK